ncbi:MAG: ferrochelatase [Myxococcaceae bacterium]|nr:ferrochelatase [Myxococcaceae bacterium]
MTALASLPPPKRTAVVLMNIGSPEAPETGPVRTYLREFLSDPRVIDIPAVARWLLLNLVILPTRPSKSAAAYRKVWRKEGSPLVYFSERQRALLQEKLGATPVILAMRYGKPSIPEAVARLKRESIDQIILVPLYPQYSSAATGSSIEALNAAFAQEAFVPSVTAVPPFWDDAGFLDTFVAHIAEAKAAFKPDHVLFSYHGLPMRQVKACDASGAHCFASANCCDVQVPANHACYRAQSFATTRALAAKLGLTADAHSTSFQSRLGRTPWIQPFTDVHLDELAAKGVKRLLIACPSFVTDCLETLEEISIRAKEQFVAKGGEDVQLVPCLNDDPRWISALEGLVRRAAGGTLPVSG